MSKLSLLTQKILKHKKVEAILFLIVLTFLSDIPDICPWIEELPGDYGVENYPGGLSS